ncbi:hypothetical protein [Lentzea sp. NEAU-D7]|uniref:hypothetical protein n=1 Tax=Lentzea sp. NEAU-D7 TaxID=2994667 RepID=UPI00224B9343|nr:hypothetical protein [Lentzea sp. NEAU-D7]MCX2949923.1 hypothetical protein [Lentzea sp. NEAU-D7]
MAYTRDQVLAAVNNGSDLVRTALELGDRDDDLLNLVVNTVMSVLDDPETDLDSAIRENYETDPSEVLSWWTNWS